MCFAIDVCGHKPRHSIAAIETFIYRKTFVYRELQQRHHVCCCGSHLAKLFFFCKQPIVKHSSWVGRGSKPNFRFVGRWQDVDWRVHRVDCDAPYDNCAGEYKLSLNNEGPKQGFSWVIRSVPTAAASDGPTEPNNTRPYTHTPLPGAQPSPSHGAKPLEWSSDSLNGYSSVRPC